MLYAAKQAVAIAYLMKSAEFVSDLECGRSECSFSQCSKPNELII